MVGTINAYWISFSFASVGAIFFFFIKKSAHESREQYEGKWKILKETWSFAYKHPIYRRLFTLEAIEYIAGAAWAGSIMLVFIKEVLHKTDAWWGYIHGAYLFGTVFGGFVAIFFDQWLKKRLRAAFIIGSANLGILTIFFAFSPKALLSIIIAVVMGIPYQMRDISLQTLLQINAPPNQASRIFSVHHAVASFSIVVGVGIMGVIAEYYGPQMALVFSGILVVISAIMARAIPKTGPAVYQQITIGIWGPLPLLACQ
jgi:predicted MFS family arabinose efflux permease